MSEHLAAFFGGEATEGFARGTICFVVTGLEDELNVRGFADGVNGVGHPPEKVFGFDDAGAEDKKGLGSTEASGSDDDFGKVHEG